MSREFCNTCHSHLNRVNSCTRHDGRCTGCCDNACPECLNAQPWRNTTPSPLGETQASATTEHLSHPPRTFSNGSGAGYPTLGGGAA